MLSARDIKIQAETIEIDALANIRREMSLQDISTRELASRIGASHATVYRWLNGDYHMSLLHFIRIVDALGTTEEALLYD